MMPKPLLPPGCQVRAATVSDRWAIRRLVLSAFLKPTQLQWSQFSVVVHADAIIACGQLRPCPGAQELGSLVVARPWRGQGIGAYLTQRLIAQATQPLYLECVGWTLPQFYRGFGFLPITWQSLPVSLRGKFGLTAWAGSVLKLPVHVMYYDPACAMPSKRAR